MSVYTEFSLKIGFDVNKRSDRKTTIQLIREAGQLLSTQIAMMSKDSPDVTLVVEDNENGTREYKVFNGSEG